MKKAMTVSELIEELKYLESQDKGDMEVLFAYNYGDYWRTQVAEGVNEVTEQLVTYSDYHSMDKVIEADYMDDEDEEIAHANPANRTVIILG